METTKLLMEKDIASLTCEDIAKLYIDTKEDERLIYRSILDSLKRKEQFDCNDEIKTIALHSHFTGWLSGHWQAIKDMATELTDLGYTVYILHTAIPDEEELPDAPVKMILLPKYGDTKQEAANTVKAIEDIVNEYEIDAVIFNYYARWIKYIDYLAFKRVSSARTGKHVKCLLQFHSSFIAQHMPLGALGSTWLPDNAKCMAVFDALLTEGNVDKTFWSMYNPNCFFRPLPIPYDITSSAKSPLQSQDILYLARLSKTKNQLELIQAMKIVLEEVPNARLILAGNGIYGYESQCRLLCQELGIDSQIIFAGYVRAEEKEALLANSSIAVSASNFEGFALSMAEAKAHGLPLVMFDIPNVSAEDGGEDNGTVVVPSHDIEEMAHQLIRLLKDNDLRKELGTRAREHMKQIYDIDYSELWNSIFSATKPPEYKIANTIQSRINDLFFLSYRAISDNLATERQEHRKNIEALETQQINLDVNSLRDLTETNSIISHKLEENMRNAPEINMGTVKIAAPQRGYMDRYIPFKKPYINKPTVICSLYSSSGSPELGNITCCVSKVYQNGFVARVFNNSDTDRNPAISYIAVGL